ncbi:Hypothetical predicted protein [Olea europaea subsp. europaea]|uniref:Uncharacterized protein n=1 Tax=Olea europaea subsp. europaea TaxID=158383 RepID=A0A8S0R8J9_OLEEU|nr:Hypothetical predicted protein [Olea europaea subsp. europaea]
MSVESEADDRDGDGMRLRSWLGVVVASQIAMEMAWSGWVQWVVGGGGNSGDVGGCWNRMLAVMVVTIDDGDGGGTGGSVVVLRTVTG